MLRIRRIDQDVINNQVVAVADARQPGPRLASILRLVNTSVGGAQIEMQVVPGVGRKRARRTAVGSEREPRDRVNLWADETKDQSSPKQMKAAEFAVQRCDPIP